MSLKKKFSPFSRISIRLRLAILFVFIFGVTTLIFNVFIFKSMTDTLQQDFDDALFNYAIDVSAGIEIGTKGDLNFPPLRLDDGKIFPFPLGTALIQVRHSSGAVLARVGNFGSFNPPYKKDFQKIWSGEEATYRTIENIHDIPAAEADSYRLISFPLDNIHKPQLLLQIAVPMTLLETQLQQRLALWQLGVPFVLIIATLGGIFLSARALKPLNNMIQTAQEIKAGELSRRVPIPDAKDEIKELALTFNEMLDRIQQAFLSQERFVADASHQLITPLAIMKIELENLKKSDQKELDRFINSSLQEVDKLTGIVQEMLLLARVDAGLDALTLQKLSLDELVFEVLPQYEKLAKTHEISIKMDLVNNSQEDRKYISGDKDLLSHLVANLIENAIKYSPIKEAIQINITWRDDVSSLSVEDNGQGIPEDKLPYIFDRFSRGAHVETKVKGFGLGLAISQKIAQLHHTKIQAFNKPEGGAVFYIEIKNI